jgi:hypothetical protein
MPEPQQYYWCTAHKRVEPAHEACGMDQRIGPFDTPEQAEHWQDRVEQRNEDWDTADRAWEGDD